MSPPSVCGVCDWANLDVCVSLDSSFQAPEMENGVLLLATPCLLPLLLFLLGSLHTPSLLPGLKITDGRVNNIKTSCFLPRQPLAHTPQKQSEFCAVSETTKIPQA